ncbi:aldehyde dehydrogenase family protein [Agrobacterium genomosp. 13]|uniref:NAD-dependent aldehyde dehydrogenase n=1 Tax=Agrobacterium genomosp. 13 str. CFBP 6927 TaxID=1183428 RepID=A0ABM9VL87_9HYPH
MTIRINNYIGGKNVGASVDEFGIKIDPRTGEKLEEVTYSSAAEVRQAIDVADNAFSEWRDMRPSERGRTMVELGRVIRANGKRLGEIESAETGKPGHEMPTLIDLTAQFFEFYGGIVNVMDGEVINQGPDYHVYTRRDPFGVIGVILPWNAPLHQAARAIAPALAVGNTVVAKPSERGGSVCLNSFERFVKWISASIMPPPSSVPAR